MGHKKKVKKIGEQPSAPKAKAQPNRKARAGKRALRSSFLSVFVIVFSLAVLVFVIYHLYDYIAAKPKFEFIPNGRVEHTIGATALIVRNEEVIRGNSSGDLVTKATEGSHVSRDQLLALVVPDKMTSVVNNLRNTQSQISDVQQEVIASGNAASAEHIYANVDEDLSPIIDLLRLDSMNGTLNNLSSYESSIAVLIDKRQKELTKVDDFNDERLNLLQKDEKSYESQLEKSSVKVKAPNPGVVSYKLDGMEETLSFDYLLTAEPKDIYQTISDSTGVITSDLFIEDNEAVARISSNDKQLLAVVLEGKDVKAEDFQKDSVHNINVASEGVTIDNCIVERSAPFDSGLLVVFSTSRHVESLIGLRTVNIEIVITSTSGLRVPITSLVNPDFDRGVSSIYTNNDGFATEVSVFIKDYDREFAIIAPFEGSVPNNKTVIITNPSSVKVGDKVE